MFHSPRSESHLACRLALSGAHSSLGTPCPPPAPLPPGRSAAVKFPGVRYLSPSLILHGRTRMTAMGQRRLIRALPTSRSWRHGGGEGLSGGPPEGSVRHVVGAHLRCPARRTPPLEPTREYAGSSYTPGEARVPAIVQSGVRHRAFHHRLSRLVCGDGANPGRRPEKEASMVGGAAAGQGSDIS